MIEVKAYEGLIRNHKDLASELGLSCEGLTRREREEQIAAAAYKAWGKDMGLHINGQFALVLFDTDTNEFFLTRDILGAELLFYYETADGTLLYGTQIADLFDQAGFIRELNTELVPYYLEFTYVPGEETLFKGVRKIEPGGYLISRAGGIETGRYWELTFEPDESKTLGQWAGEISEAMEASLRDICDEGDAPDSFLSGGVDSSYIMAKSTARCGYCVSYENQEASEEGDARATAQLLGRGFEGVTVTPSEFFENVDEFLRAYEQPSGDVAGLALFCACKKVVQSSKLCFSGEGADEFFAGYGVYSRVDRLRMTPGAVYMGTTHIMNPSEMHRYLKEYKPSVSAREFMKERSKGGRTYDPLSQMLYTDLRSYFEGSILFNSTKIARGTGLDIRMPYCDLRIFDISRRMPSKYKATKDANKIALRAAAERVLPRDVAYRKKLGFPVPIRAWLKDASVNSDLRRAFESPAAEAFFNTKEIGALLDAFLGEKPRASHPVWFARHQALLWRHVWTIYLFIRWYEIFFEE